eukprot:gene21550-33157_t
MARDDIKPNGALRAEIDAWVLAASGGSDCGSRAATEPEEDEQVAVEMDPPGLVPAGSEGGSAAEPHGPPGARALRPGSGGGGGSEGREESAGGVPNEPFGQSRGARRHRLGTLVAAGFVDGGECGARTSDCTSSASDGTSSVPVDSASPSESPADFILTQPAVCRTSLSATGRESWGDSWLGLGTLTGETRSVPVDFASLSE